VDSAGDIRAIWDDLYMASLPYGRKGLAVMALSGVDLALWDALGKAEGKPVYELLGGLRKPRVRAYATGEDAEWYRELGFTATKFSHRWTGSESDYDRAVASASRAREVFGTDALIMIDTYMTWDAAVTQEMAKRLAEFEIYWFEDVLTPDDLEGQAALRPLVKPVLVSGGEHEFTHHGFAEVARVGALDLWQPDITWCGGITAGLRILDIARDAGIPVCPHRGGEVWGLHLIAASDCIDLAEVHSGTFNRERDQLWLNEPQARDGYIAPADAPGFGVALNEAMLV
jgi:L-rhamnonate dehydratase